MTDSLPLELVDRVLAAHPTPIADAVAAVVAADDARERRDRVVEAFRAAVRLVSAMVLAARVQYGPGPAGDRGEVATLLQSLRRRGLTDGQWVGLTRALLLPFADSPEGHVLPELVRGLVGRRARLSDPIEGFLVMRKSETVAHGPAGEDSDVRVVLERRTPQLVCLLMELEPLWQRLELVVPLAAPAAGKAQRAFRLVGGTPHRGRWRRRELATPTPSGEPVWVDGKGRAVLAQHPLALFRSPTPEALDELFLLDGGHRKQARFVAFPSMAEHREGEVWDRLEKAMLGDPAEEDSDISGDRPFRGLESYASEHTSLFFGREQQAEALANRVRTHGMVAVTGASGSGKTSLLLAGVVPRLSDFDVVRVRPGEAPLLALSRRLSETTDLDPGRLLGLTETDPRGLTELLYTWSRDRGRGLVVLVDQAEELLTLCSETAAREAFAAVLVALSSDPDGPLRVICSLREDFFGPLASLRALDGRLQRQVEVVATPRREDLVRILVLPATSFGFQFEDHALVDTMVDAVADEPGALSLLAFCADQLWEHRDRTWKRLTWAAYDGVGGVSGALTTRADQVVDGLGLDVAAAAKRVLLRLVDQGGTRTRVPMDELRGDRAVVDALVAARLVRISGDGDEARVELVHEALAAHWGRLRDWLAEDRAGHRFIQSLRRRARDWVSRDRADGLLLTDDLLDELKLRHGRGELAHLGPEDPVLEFGEASLALDRRRRRQRALALTVGFTTFAVLSVSLAVALGQASLARGEVEAALETTQRALRESEIRALESASGESDARGARTDGLAYLRSAADLAEGPEHQALLGEVAARLQTDGVARVLGRRESAVRHLTAAGDLVAAAWNDGRVRVWRSDTGEVLAEPWGVGIGDVRSLALGSGVLVSAVREHWETSSDRVRVWDTSTWAVRSEWRIQGRTNGVVVDSTGTWAATLVTKSDGDSVVARFRIDNPTDVLEFDLSATRGRPNHVAFMDQGSLAITAAGDPSRLTLWDAEGALMSEWPLEEIPRNLVSRDGRVAVQGLNTVQLFEHSGPQWEYRPQDPIQSVLLADDGGMFISMTTTRFEAVDAEGRRVWSRTAVVPRVPVALTSRGVALPVEGGISVRSVADGSARGLMLHPGQVDEVISTQEGQIVTGTTDGTVWAWAVDDLPARAAEAAMVGMAWRASLFDGGAWIAAFDGGLQMWDIKSPSAVAVASGVPGRWPCLLEADPNGGATVVWSSRCIGFPVRVESVPNVDSPPVVWDRASVNGTLDRQEIEVDPDGHLALSKDGTRLALSGMDGCLRVFSREGELASHCGFERVRGLAFLDQRVFVTTEDFNAGWLNPEDGSFAKREGQTALHAFAIDAVGNHVALVHKDGDLSLFPARAGGPEVALVELGREPIGMPLFTPDGGLVVIASTDGSISTTRVDNAESTTFRAHDVAIEAIAMSPDGTRLATVASDRIRQWTLPGGRLLAEHAITPGWALTLFYVDYDLVAGGVGRLVRWGEVSDDMASALALSGGATNLRVCRDDHRVVPVVPYPPAETVWAPALACEMEIIGVPR